MLTTASGLVRAHLPPGIPGWRRAAGMEPPRGALGWQALPRGAQVSAASGIAAGASPVAAFFPLDYPPPVPFALLLPTSFSTPHWTATWPLPLPPAPPPP